MFATEAVVIAFVLVLVGGVGLGLRPLSARTTRVRHLPIAPLLLIVAAACWGAATYQRSGCFPSPWPMEFIFVVPILLVYAYAARINGWVTVGIVIGGFAAVSVAASFAPPKAGSSEPAAIGVLRSLVAAEAVWREKDLDGNGRPDYWVADVFGLYACADAAGNPIRAIASTWSNPHDDYTAAVAKADRRPYRMPDVKRARPYCTVPPPDSPIAKSGYLFEALPRDEQGKPYARDENRDGKACENASKFAFMAVPEAYGRTGVNVYIVNEEGVIYGRDFGRTPEPGEVAWPGEDPTTADPPWRVVQ